MHHNYIFDRMKVAQKLKLSITFGIIFRFFVNHLTSLWGQSYCAMPIVRISLWPYLTKLTKKMLQKIMFWRLRIFFSDLYIFLNDRFLIQNSYKIEKQFSIIYFFEKYLIINSKLGPLRLLKLWYFNDTSVLKAVTIYHHKLS